MRVHIPVFIPYTKIVRLIPRWFIHRPVFLMCTVKRELVLASSIRKPCLVQKQPVMLYHQFWLWRELSQLSCSTVGIPYLRRSSKAAIFHLEPTTDSVRPLVDLRFKYANNTEES